jgi:hypothetical protein
MKMQFTTLVESALITQPFKSIVIQELNNANVRQDTVNNLMAFATKL